MVTLLLHHGVFRVALLLVLHMHGFRARHAVLLPPRAHGHAAPPPWRVPRGAAARSAYAWLSSSACRAATAACSWSRCSSTMACSAWRCCSFCICMAFELGMPCCYRRVLMVTLLLHHGVFRVALLLVL